MRYCVFDTETTDLITNSLRPLPKQPHIVEFYGCVWDSQQREVVAEYECLCRVPDHSMTEKATATHGFTEEMLKDYHLFRDHAATVKAFIEQSNAVVAHNLNYDYWLVEYETRRAGLVVNWPITRICTVENTEHLKGHRLSLGRNRKGEPGLYHLLFGEDFLDAHRAKPDTKALLRCFVELLDRKIL